MTTSKIWSKVSRRSITSSILSTLLAWIHLLWNLSRVPTPMCSFWHKTLTRFFSHRTQTSRAKGSSASSPALMKSRKILENRPRLILLREARSLRMTFHLSASGLKKSSKIKSERYRSQNVWKIHPLLSLDRCQALCALWCKWWKLKGRSTTLVYHNRCNRQQKSKSLKSTLPTPSLSTWTISERQIKLPRSSSQNSSLIMLWCNQAFLSICKQEQKGSSSLSRAT